MTPCPSDEQLTALLADALSTAEQGLLARHVEGCLVCQDRLAHLSQASDTAMGWCAAQPSQVPEGEEEAVRRLKRMLPAALPRPERVARSDPADADWPDVPGYEILGELGRGGMGVVYKARQLALDRPVALKMVLTGHLAGARDLARFRAEAGVIARLQHPNIVQIHDIGEAAGQPFFALEFMAGGSLAQHLDGTPQPIRPAAQLVETLARAIHHAHVQGILHRDLKPGNVLFTGPTEAAASLPLARFASVAKIADFGLAKCMGEEAFGLCGLTVTGEVMGTPSYMAPEQAVPRFGTVGPHTDVHALGVILYEMLTGRPPFLADTPLETALQLAHEEPVPIRRLRPGVPRDLETICLKCLHKAPQKRYASALELAEDIRRFLRDEPIQARPAQAGEKLWRWVRRHPVPVGLLAAGLIAPLVALIAFWLLSARLVRSSARESAAQQAELLETANDEYSRIVRRVEQARFPVNKTVPPTPGTVPLSIPATFLHDVGEQLHQTSKTGVQVRQYSDHPFPWRTDSGPRDAFEREALRRLRQSKGQETVHEFTEINGQRVVRYAQARVMRRACVECHNSHPQSPRKNWQEGDVRGVLEIIRPLDKDEARIGEALRLALLLGAVVSALLLTGSVLGLWASRRRSFSLGARR